jgi:hypothetical protein
MPARYLFTAALSTLAVLVCVGDASAQLRVQWPAPAPGLPKPPAWVPPVTIPFPQKKETGSTLPVMVYPETKPAPLPPAKPNYNQFQGYNPQGRPVFTNPATGQTTVGNATGRIGVPTTLGEIKKMQARRP